MSAAPQTIPVVRHIEPYVSGYDVMLCDVWGVLHNGRDVFGEAVEACVNFRSRGGSVILISNSPRPRPRLIEQLDELGVDRGAYDGIVTSGDVTRAHLSNRPGATVLHIGPERDKGIFDGLAVEFGPAEAADIVVCSGLFDDTQETPADYEATLAGLKAHGLTMICANPDVMVERGDSLIYCAGALAQAYEALDGDVIYAGKPYRPIYDLALAIAGERRDGPVDLARAVAVGDGLETDMAGAAAMAIDALFIASGLHVDRAVAELDEAVVMELFAGREALPVAASARLAW